ncbi:ATP-binding protein [Paraburkholderia caballeronis]|uniref:ATP-binding protein n=1 Tax=Paraburkholderia caballeronis TaxID=416943 RepID=UPI0014170B00|nr:ATP-binding protein [Paraburkholderia caballeronis]
MEQYSFEFDDAPEYTDSATWTPKDIWVRLSQRLLEYLREDRRIERKNNKNPSLDDLAKYYSTFSNTPDGGLLVYGVKDSGEIEGCHFNTNQINSVEQCHINHCPMAKPEFKRVSVVVNGEAKYCLAIYIPYVGKLVETNKGEAWIRYGDSKHLMSEEAKNDFRATRQELSFELTEAYAYKYPNDFDLRILQDFCDKFRENEQRGSWSNEEILVDRNLLRVVGDDYKPLNSLVLLAAHRPDLTIPGCRVRVQRFSETKEGSGESYSPLRDKVIEGNLVKIIQDAQEFIASQIYDVTWLNKDGKFITTPEYPQWAWFEALVNACVHRSYSFSGTEITVKLFPDRMEVESPGGFVPPVNEKTIYYTRSSRNHHLMDALRYLGYVRMAREGTRRIRESMKEYQLPDPVFKQENLYGVVVRVTLKNDQETRRRASDQDVALYFGVDLWKKMSEHEIKIAAYAFRNGSINVSEAQRLTGRTWATSKKDLDRMAKKEILMFEPGTYIRDSKAKYSLVKSADVDKSNKK